MTTVHDIYTLIDKIAPFSLAIDYDNCGLLIGSNTQEVSSCILALDITKEVIAYAIKNKAQLIVTHHPIIFHPIQSVTDRDLIFQLIQHNISVISAHTNLDIALGGVNDVLASLIGLHNVAVLERSEGAVRIGRLIEPLTGKELAQKVKHILRAKGVLVCNGDKIVKTVAVAGGAGSDYLTTAIDEKADVYITGEVKHNVMIDAINQGITLISAGHHYTEIPAMIMLKTYMEHEFTALTCLLYDDFLVEEV